MTTWAVGDVRITKVPQMTWRLGLYGLVPTPGHTPGHVSVEIFSRGESAVITGDLAHHPVELFAPDWTMVADVDPAQGVASRRAFIDRFGDGEALILGTHFGGTSAGRFDAATRTWTPA